ncbi:GMC oxidoreductase [Halobacteriovorax sp. HLS]|uniref:GMC oxidoreductase n=1 Tax=Halobacteriovorax sp. HLS TaxID=2234000 RepID=UPI000FD6EBA3|nr:GMC oxidoreductase [Halobacteriovorax sp. HLS]
MDSYDFIIVGSGFGGSVSACRLTQKNYKVALLEKGRDYRSKSKFPKTNWDIYNYLWAPIIRCFGIQSITVLKNLLVLHGVGVGGGSLVYANTLLRPAKKIFNSSFWPSNLDWNTELDHHYNTASKMLGVTKNPKLHAGEKILEELSKELNCHHTFEETNIGVYFDGEQGVDQDDPYFSGDGPKRRSCTSCGSCMIGCPEGAKNTLDKNYLHFASKWGADIFAETTVDKIEKVDDEYVVTTFNTCGIFRKKRVFKAKKVILSAGVMGTLDILYRNKLVHKTLPDISNRLGEVVRTNGESLLGVTSKKYRGDLSEGVAIGAQIRPDEHTKIEAVRYPKGSDFMKLLTVPLTESGSRLSRPFKMIRSLVQNFIPFSKILLSRDWASNSVILLVMQSLDSKMSLRFGRTMFRGFTKGLIGDMGDEVMETSIPVAQESAKIIAKNIDGQALNCSLEVAAGSIATAHVLGGAVMAQTVDTGVVDTNHEVFGYNGLYICDASVIPANLAVNPSLTICALAERFSSQFEMIGHSKREIKFSTLEA